MVNGGLTAEVNDEEVNDELDDLHRGKVLLPLEGESTQRQKNFMK